MARLSTYTCDECASIKREINGWWLISPGTNGIEVWHWSNIQNCGDGWHHLCGPECAAKYLLRWMAERAERP